MILIKRNSMKNIKIILGLVFLTISSIGFISCEGDDSGPATVDGPPVINRVTLAINDSTTTVGLRENMYRIYGENLATTKEIYFNDTKSYFNPTLVTNTTILVSIPKETPYFDASDELKVVTSEGVAVIDFPIEQPAPEIDSFSPVAAGAGEIVTIVGSIFEGLESVRFGETEAVIVSSTSTEIQVEVPEGIVQSYIFVETLGGVTQSEQAFGFKFVIYDDALKEGWWVGGWDGSEDFENTEQVKRGDFSIKRIYNGGYSGFQIGNGGAPLPISDYSAVKVSIYGEQNVGNLRFSINALNEQELGVILQVEEGQWNDFEISLDDPALIGENELEVFSQIVIQELSGNSNVIIYIDDLGLI
ncbi:MAG: hypothetical protein CMH15_05860 [Mesonia sp.]|nr:hypothetical protein [Mesonia sp.]MAQ40566.1 hypothetical protein [Mesonia sp.]|tara:strand:- start:8321 stop:9400 length:1080 start_codon:yes stop_codon:yes gene_type:complete